GLVFCFKVAILRKVAVAMQTVKGQAANIIQKEDLRKLIEDYLREELHFSQARAAANALINQLRDRNFILCFVGDDSYAFVHRTFLEYFCATEFVHRFEKKKTLSLEGLLALYDSHCLGDDWQEVLRLICGQLDEQFAGKIIAHLTDKVDMEAWDGEIPPPELVLAVWCLSEVKKMKRIDKKVGADLLLKVVDCFLLGDTGYHSGPDGFVDFSEGLCAAAKTVGSEWPGKSKFHFYGQCPKYDISTYQTSWPFFISAVFQQRQWIEELIQQNSDDIHSSSLAALATYWPDDKTRQLIIQNIFSDHKGAFIYDSYPSNEALKLLVQHWPDDNTRRLITELIQQGVSGLSCCRSLELLAEHWPDDDTRQLIKKQTLVNGVAASLYGKEHSRFGRLVFYDSSTILAFGYLNPRQPIPTEHIQKAAEVAGIPPNKINETVRSLSEHMGWDITKGSEAGQLPA
ncbi:MAG: hypothetical protein D3903_19765, partial [Candidatus Electrothrix sp. GM3_4]|nr:hypothetical protein [Candidatus Electrothrix sp. GM3_4]